MTEEEDSLASRAIISSIKDTWRENADYSGLLNKASMNSATDETKKQDFLFVINDDYTYHQLSDFNSFSARELFMRVMEAEKKLKEAKKELELKRVQYSAATSINKSSLATEILQLEKLIEELYDQWKVTIVMTRNEEIRHLNALK